MCYFNTKDLYCYNVITITMSELFEAKLRKIGNSLGVIVPGHIIKVLEIHRGDTVKLVIPHSENKRRNKKLLSLVGIDKDKKPFKRDKEDRY